MSKKAAVIWIAAIILTLIALDTLAERVAVHVIKYRLGSDVTYVLPGPCGPVYVEIEPEST